MTWRPIPVGNYENKAVGESGADWIRVKGLGMSGKAIAILPFDAPTVDAGKEL